MPLPKQSFELNADYVGRGFWFALGFTPVFLLLSGLAWLLFIYVSFSGLGAYLASNPPRMPAYADSIARTTVAPAVDSLAPVVQSVAPSHAEIGPARKLSQAERQERECSQLMLQFSETQDPAVKEQMYKVCP